MEEIIQVILDAMPMLLVGLWWTVIISVASLVIATALGLVSGLMRVSHSRVLQWIAACYVNLIRGTPLLIQILFIYFGIPGLTHQPLSPLAAGIAAVSLNIGAYLCEVFRAGIESIDRGQTEAGRSMGLTRGQTMRIVILPQAVRRMMPSFINHFIVGIKDTSLLSVIGVAELTSVGQSIYSMNFKAFEILALVGALYFIVNYALSNASRRLEKRIAVS